MPRQATPAPMYLPASMIACSMISVSSWNGMSVRGVDRVVQVHAGQDREHVGLQSRDEHFERRQSDGHGKRQDRADPAHETEAAEHQDEAREYFQGDVAGEHVGEETDGMAD